MSTLQAISTPPVGVLTRTGPQQQREDRILPKQSGLWESLGWGAGLGTVGAIGGAIAGARMFGGGGGDVMVGFGFVGAVIVGAIGGLAGFGIGSVYGSTRN